MFRDNLSNELKKVLSYIEDEMVVEYPTNQIYTNYFITACLIYKDCFAYDALTRVLISETMEELRLNYDATLRQQSTPQIREPKFSKELTNYIEHPFEILKKHKHQLIVEDSHLINSINVLCAILSDNQDAKEIFAKVGLTIDQLSWDKEEESPSPKQPSKPIKHQKPKTPKQTIRFIDTTQFNETNDGQLLVNISEKIGQRIESKFYGREDILKMIFRIFSQKDNNNVILVGNEGVGKTAIAKQLAFLIARDEAPIAFRDLKVIELKLKNIPIAQSIPTINKVKNVIDFWKKKGNYIVLVDDLLPTLFMNRNIPEMDTKGVLDYLFSDSELKVICTTTPKCYTSYIENDNTFNRLYTKIDVLEPEIEEAIKMVDLAKEEYEAFHNIQYSKETIEDSVRWAHRYFTDASLPQSALQLLDETAAMLSLDNKESKKLVGLRERLAKATKKKEEYKETSETKDYDLIDNITKDIINIESAIKREEKENIFNNSQRIVTPNDVKQLLSKRMDMPMGDLTMDDRQKLRGITQDLNKIVIGQEEAVTEVCKAIKRQRVGLSNPNKPAVLFFGGSTGTGKTYLAKKIAERIFGSEQDLVRLDMSEYNDKVSATKLYGASAGYVGYENGGILTETIKKHKHCVLLLDEIEKADASVHDVFLQIFDDGKLEDNHGVKVDFKNVIIIMTSNVGAVDVENRGDGIGFVKDNQNYDKRIIAKALKRKFKPEFINRIDKIVYFNRLSDDNIKNIIQLELEKLSKKIEGLGYTLTKDVTSNNVVEYLFNIVRQDKAMGARPILRVIQDTIENQITEKMIDCDIEKGYEFTLEDIGIII